MPRAVIGRWGKNLAIRVPAEVARTVGLSDGQQVEILSSGEGIVVRKVRNEPTLASMFEGRTPEAWRTLYQNAYDWGEDQGRERLGE